MAALAQESTFGRYTIEEKLAQGGMAEIFLGRAADPHGLDRPVVIKRILPHIAASPEFVEMLVQEAKLVVQLSHGNIAQVYDLGRIGEDYFMVMEYVAGKSLSQIARRLRLTGEKIPVPIALYIASEIASGLDYMHHKTDTNGHPLNIIHRDISPQNIIISHSGTVKIIDFGIAKAATQVSTTDSGVVKGKFAYMSPEHAQGERLDARTDIFSLGVILWELLTNQRLFKGKNNKETINRVKRCHVPSVSGYRDDVPKDVEKILKQALAKGKKNRYTSSHDLLLDLIRALVHHYPKFAPKDLEDYLKHLFQDQWQEEATVVEAKSDREAVTFIDEAKEATALADPKVLKLRLKELESYQVPEPEAVPPAAEAPVATEAAAAKPPPPVMPSPIARHWQELLAAAEPWLTPLRRFGQRHLPRPILKRWVGALVVIVLLGYAASYSFHLIERWTESPIKTASRIPIDAPSTLPSPPPPPPIQWGAVEVRSTPLGAKIYLDDRDTGKLTPARLERIEAGTSHRIGLYHADYQYWEKTFQTGPDEQTTIEAELKLNFGGIEVESDPPGAAVWIGDKSIGTTPLRLDQLKPGSTYKLRIVQAGFAEWQREVKIFAGRIQKFRAILEKER